MKRCFLFFLTISSTISYSQFKSPFFVNKANFEQKFKFEVDKTEIILNEQSSSYTSMYGSSLFMITVLENKKDVTFNFALAIKELKKGSYTISACEDCDDNQNALYISHGISSGSFPKSGAYNIPALNLKPLEFVIMSVEDAKFTGTPLKVKRVKGYFSGNFAAVNDGKIIGSVNYIKGEFDIACVILKKE
jgi:hypothetical protein